MGNSALVSRFGAHRGFAALVTGFVMLLTVAACGNISDRFKVPAAATVVVATDGTDSTDGNDGSDDDGACAVAADCNDKDKSTIDTCVDGECVHKQVTCNDGFELNEVGECVKVQVSCPSVEDSDLCTLDSCDPATGEALHVMKACDDEDDTTDDSCDPKTGDCNHQVSCGNCADDNACTVDSCDPKTGECLHDKVECPSGFACSAGECKLACADASDCNDENWCTIDGCDEEFGVCTHELRDCADDDDTTTDACVPALDNKGECVNVPSECTPGCDDKDACTKDSCNDGVCLNVAAPCGTGTVCDPTNGQCLPAKTECAIDANCNDGNACTADECEAGVCTHPAKTCPANTLCDAKSGSCKTLAECEVDCDDGDKCTADVCNDGVCESTSPKCGNGTSLNPTTCVCEITKVDPQCTNGTVQCQQIESTGTIAYMICASGSWWVVENCGPINLAACQDGQGCKALGAAGGPSNPPPSNPPANPPASSACSSQISCPSGQFCGGNTCYPYSDLHGMTSEKESGANGGKPDGQADSWDWDGDCYCAGSSCVGSSNSLCGPLSGGDCDELGIANHPGGYEWKDNYDNDCNGSYL